MRTDTFDVVVVGGGPAGALTALRLARAGCHVALLDASRFPRSKPCGGGLQERCLPYLPVDISSLTKSVCTAVRFTDNLTNPFTKQAHNPLVRCVLRSEFDTFLFHSARTAGAVAHEGTRVRHITSESDSFLLNTESGALRCRYLVGADGANSVVGRLLNTRSDFFWQTALYAELPAARFNKNGFDQSILRIDWGTLRPGYAWVFPKGDLVNIGAGGPNRLAPFLRLYLREFLKVEQLTNCKDVKWTGHQLPTMTATTSLSGNGVFLVGDAGGMVEPLTGEGISYACHGAHLLAEQLLFHFNRPDAERAYAHAVRTEIQSEIECSRKILRVANIFPRTFAASFSRSTAAWTALCKVLRGELSFRHVRRELLGPLHLAQYLLAPVEAIQEAFYDAAKRFQQVEN